MVINLFETWCFQELIQSWNSDFTFVFVILCDAYITRAATDEPYRADHRETVHKIWFRYGLDDLELKIFFVVQPWWSIFFMLHLPRNLGPHLLSDNTYFYLRWTEIVFLSRFVYFAIAKNTISYLRLHSYNIYFPVYEKKQKLKLLHNKGQPWDVSATMTIKSCGALFPSSFLIFSKPVWKR